MSGIVTAKMRKTMSTRALVLTVAGLVLGASALLAQPTNDNFANRAVLSGSSVLFSGNLTNSSLEAGEPLLPYGSTGLYRSNSLDGSLWWTWTAPMSSPVVISILRDYSKGGSEDAVLEVFSGTNFAQLQQIDYTPF